MQLNVVLVEDPPARHITQPDLVIEGGKRGCWCRWGCNLDAELGPPSRAGPTLAGRVITRTARTTPTTRTVSGGGAGEAGPKVFNMNLISVWPLLLPS